MYEDLHQVADYFGEAFKETDPAHVVHVVRDFVLLFEKVVREMKVGTRGEAGGCGAVAARRRRAGDGAPRHGAHGRSPLREKPPLPHTQTTAQVSEEAAATAAKQRAAMARKKDNAERALGTPRGAKGKTESAAVPEQLLEIEAVPGQVEVEQVVSAMVQTVAERAADGVEYGVAGEPATTTELGKVDEATEAPEAFSSVISTAYSPAGAPIRGRIAIWKA